MRTTFIAKPADIQRKWYVVDASGHTLGRLSAEIAKVLRGKNKPIFTPFMDTGDNVIVINAEKIGLTGNKLEQKMYRHYSGYPGGLKEENLRTVLRKRPADVIYHSVRGMLPKNNLGKKTFSKLHVYAGPEHPHQAQKPEPLEITY